MAKVKKEIVKNGWREIWGIVCLVIGAMLTLSVIRYAPGDLALFQSPPNSPAINYFGSLGAWLGTFLFMTLGLGGYLVPIIFYACGFLCIFRFPRRVSIKLGWMLVFLMAVVCMMELLPEVLAEPVRQLNTMSEGGLIGEGLGDGFFIKYMGSFGSAVLLACIILVSSILLFEIQPAMMFQGMGHAASVTGGAMFEFFRNMGKEDDETLYDDEIEVAKSRRRLEKVTGKEPAEAKAEPKKKPRRAMIKEESKPEPQPEVEEEEPEPDVVQKPRLKMPSLKKKAAKGSAKSKAEPIPEDSILVPEDTTPAFAGSGPRNAQYKLPSMKLLEDPPRDNEPTVNVEERKAVLLATLKEFGVDATVENVEAGPTVTSYEILPAPGVRVEKIAGLSNNIALALKAEGIRVQAPVPGKGVVGIEIPNLSSQLVTIKQIMQSKAWKKNIALPVCLGMDVSGKEIVADLAEMPHLLIAGATGSGKSVCMNSLLAGLLMSRTPDQLRLMLVDPKIVEFTSYNDLPHLVVPVITDPKKVSLGLRWAITEMEKRYKTFAKIGVRNIKAFNNRKRDEQPDLFDATGEDLPEADRVPDTLPYIVIVIDELADLMMVAQSDVESSIARLAQLSRAVGIHMVIATQRPSVNVITGTIKANFPARIAFQVAQKVDSRTILDANGADKLIGKGDMLFLPPGIGRLIRVQGAMCTDDEINKIVGLIKEQGKPEYVTAVKDKIENPAPLLPDQESDEDTEILEQAVEVIRQTKRASTSSLQRRLRIGYNRAARLMDLLEEKGIVGPPQGSDPREILIDLDGEIPQNPEED
jgi:S-DNA-T family DNA segregation ATPase FtsK/SpoIIIE